MYVVVNISPGSDMSLLMETLASRTLTFSVTDDLSKLCGKCSRDCQPLPVPHQVPEPSPPAPPKESGSPSCSHNIFPATIKCENAKKTRTTPLLPRRGAQKEVDSRKRVFDEEISEPDPSWSDDSPLNKNLQAQMALSQFSQAAMAVHEAKNISNPNQLFRNIKHEPGTSEPPMNETTAAGLVSDLFKKIEEIVDGQPAEEVGNLRSTKDMFRGECRLCQMPISIRTHHMRRHAMKHLGFKTYICKICEKDFNRSDLCKSHFERYHPASQIIPFQDIITSEQQEKLGQMIQICFPDEYRGRQFS